MLTDSVRDRATGLETTQLPAYIYDLDHLSEHVAGIRARLPERLELYYAAKANAEPAILRAVAPHVDGFDVSSGGELEHVRVCTPEVPLAFSGPGKSPDELARALRAGVERIHVESLHELAVLDTLATEPVGVLLRVNLPVPESALAGRALTMGGSPSPFGLDPGSADEALRRISAAELPRVVPLGIHAHLASGLDAAQQVEVARRVVARAAELFARHDLPLREVNVGGGMAVDYADPAARFDWTAYGDGMADLVATVPDLTLRIEPGRALTAYSGWYATDVLDVKPSDGRGFAVLRGGTHHIRTPATKGHDQPCTVLRVEAWEHPWRRPASTTDRVDLVGQLCTPKDMLSRNVPVEAGLRVGDRVAFAMAGAYAWNISHHDFLMHPKPTVHFLAAGDRLGATSR